MDYLETQEYIQQKLKGLSRPHFGDLVNANAETYPALRAKYLETHSHNPEGQSVKWVEEWAQTEIEHARDWLKIRARMRNKPATYLPEAITQMQECQRRGQTTLDDCVAFNRAWSLLFDVRMELMNAIQ